MAVFTGPLDKNTVIFNHPRFTLSKFLLYGTGLFAHFTPEKLGAYLNDIWIFKTEYRRKWRDSKFFF